MKAAVYHFTNSSGKRPIVYQNQLNILEDFTASKGFSVSEVFCDLSLVRRERSEFDSLLSTADNFDARVTKDFYHISKNTMKCMSIMQELKNKGIQIYSIENGSFSWEDAPTDEPLKIATYLSWFGTPNEMKDVVPVRNDILSLYAKKKTNWTVVDQYFDQSFRQKDGEQIELQRLLENRDKYDLLLVHNLNDVHWRTANFCKIREQLQLDIYSLQDGFLKYERR